MVVSNDGSVPFGGSKNRAVGGDAERKHTGVLHDADHAAGNLLTVYAEEGDAASDTQVVVFGKLFADDNIGSSFRPGAGDKGYQP